MDDVACGYGLWAQRSRTLTRSSREVTSSTPRAPYSFCCCSSSLSPRLLLGADGPASCGRETAVVVVAPSTSDGVLVGSATVTMPSAPLFAILVSVVVVTAAVWAAPHPLPSSSSWFFSVTSHQSGVRHPSAFMKAGRSRMGTYPDMPGTMSPRRSASLIMILRRRRVRKMLNMETRANAPSTAMRM